MSDPKHVDDDLWSFFRTIITAGLIAICFRAVLFEPFSIPSGSMVPSLLVGDYLFVSKYSYGYSGLSVGLGFAERNFGVKLPEGRFLGNEPQRGDVVVFKLPGETGIDYVKRLVGLPGDRLQMRNGQLYINDTLLKREKTGSYEIRGEDLEAGDPYFRRIFARQGTLYSETLPEGRIHTILEMSDEDEADNTPVFTVPAGHYFMLGDNRDNSRDSRFIGFVPRENLVGRAEIIFFSLKNGLPFWRFWEWPSHLQFDRFFKKIT